MVLRSWQNKWEELSTYFKYSDEIRRLIYTTNPIEGFHSKKWNQPMRNWALIISQLDIYFEGRLKVEL